MPQGTDVLGIDDDAPASARSLNEYCELNVGADHYAVPAAKPHKKLSSVGHQELQQDSGLPYAEVNQSLQQMKPQFKRKPGYVNEPRSVSQEAEEYQVPLPVSGEMYQSSGGQAYAVGTHSTLEDELYENNLAIDKNV